MSNNSIANSTVLAGVAQNNLSGTYQALIAVAASSGNTAATTSGPLGFRRGKIYDILVGTNGTPADNYIEWEVVRATIGTTLVWLGSISSVSSGYALDQADTGFSAFATINTSAQTNVVANTQVWYVGVNQRASYRWVAAPGSELVYAAVSSGSVNGLALESRSGGYTGTATANVFLLEQ